MFYRVWCQKSNILQSILCNQLLDINFFFYLTENILLLINLSTILFLQREAWTLTDYLNQFLDVLQFQQLSYSSSIYHSFILLKVFFLPCHHCMHTISSIIYFRKIISMFYIDVPNPSFCKPYHTNMFMCISYICAKKHFIDFYFLNFRRKKYSSSQEPPHQSLGTGLA